MKVNSDFVSIPVPVAIHPDGELEIIWHAILITAGFIAGLIQLLATRKRFGFTVRQCFTLIVLAVIGGLWGARFFYCAVHWKNFAASSRRRGYNPYLEMLNPMFGLTLQGGLMGTVLLMYIYCRRNKLSFGRAADFGAAPFALGTAFGRVGCLLNGCCYGRVMPEMVSTWGPLIKEYLGVEYLLSGYSTFRWIYRKNPVHHHHDHDGEDHQEEVRLYTDTLYAAQLYAAVGNLALCILLHQLGKKAGFAVGGRLAGTYLVLYPCMRLFLEMYRDRTKSSNDRIFSTRELRWISEAHIVSVICIAIGCAVLLRTRKAVQRDRKMS